MVFYSSKGKEQLNELNGCVLVQKLGTALQEYKERSRQLTFEEKEHSQIGLRPGCKPICIEAGKVEGAAGGRYRHLLGCRCPVVVL